MKPLPSLAVYGCMSTNEIVYVNTIIGANQVCYTNDSSYVAGGKGTNMACMIKTLVPEHMVYFISKTAKDPHHLWEYPYTALKEIGVDTRYVTIVPDSPCPPNRVIALIERASGNKAYIVMPGITETFSPADIDCHEEVFSQVQCTQGMVVTSFEIPVETMLHIIRKANAHGLPVLLDVGGIMPDFSLHQLFAYDIFLLKPNRYETRILTGIDVSDEQSAWEAATCMCKGGVQNVLITVGPEGAYLMNQTTFMHIPIPSLIPTVTSKNATGCGDQVLSTFCVQTLQGESVEQAAHKAIIAGTLQLYKPGIIPVTQEELAEAIIH